MREGIPNFRKLLVLPRSSVRTSGVGSSRPSHPKGADAPAFTNWKEPVMSTPTPKRPTIVRIWRGRTKRERADEYEAYNYEAGIKPLIRIALGVQTFREDREGETEFMTISYWESVEAMSEFTGSDPTKIHHLERDEAFLIELPKEVQILRLRTSHGVTGSRQDGSG
jgi:heme-degrading monooxygenase HmoA